jgi:lipopolysaccharide transport system permease protein
MTNPHAVHRTSLAALARSLWQHRNLIAQLTRREVVGRYRGSVMGLAWSFMTPILMLVVYTFVFSVVFKARWGTSGDESRADFAVVLFVGMIVYGLFAEMVNRAPGLILANANYVKKVVFPLEILPVVSMGGAVFHALVSILVLVVAIVMTNGVFAWTALLLPVVILPLLIATLGLVWCLAALGVYLRDVGQTVGIFTTVALFLSPVFYPMSALPENFQIALQLNPLTFIIEQCRAVVIFGQWPQWQGLALYTFISVMVAWAGFWWFQKTRKGFADVL